jgi:ADP-ribosylglycohydrolase
VRLFLFARTRTVLLTFVVQTELSPYHSSNLSFLTQNTMASSRRSACYLEQSLPAAMDMLSKYGIHHEADVWMGLLANANLGGENVHRGSIMGAVLGGLAGEEQLPSQLKEGLFEKEALSKEIDDFVRVVLAKNGGVQNTQGEL